MENHDETAVYVAIQGLQSTNKIKFEIASLVIILPLLL
jgi:hypothetical protein